MLSMNNNKKTALLIINFFLISFLVLGNSVPVFAAGSVAGTYSYSGTIIKTSSSSLTLYNNLTVLITAKTVCKQTSKVSGDLETVSCSSFSDGNTVTIKAVKNSSGQLEALSIDEVYY